MSGRRMARDRYGEGGVVGALREKEWFAKEGLDANMRDKAEDISNPPGSPDVYMARKRMKGDGSFMSPAEYRKFKEKK